MKQFAVYPIAVLVTLLLAINTAYSQFTVQITVNEGSATTTCTDPFSNPDPMWSVNIDNQGWVTYPSNILCYNDFPNLQYEVTYDCFVDIPPTVNVCFRAFENDASIFDPCNEVFSCQAEVCIDVPIPPFGSEDFTIELPDGLASDGEVSLTIASEGIPGGFSDLICSALDLGTLENGTTIGKADTSIFNNYCSTNLNEPSPNQFGNYFTNQQGVWFQFTTGADPGTHIRIKTLSDPSNFGDPIHLEVGVFSSLSGTCLGPWEFYHEIQDPTSWDETIYLRCPQPNTTYYILVDGKNGTQESVEGFFGLEVTEMEIVNVGNLPCEATDLGQVPLGGAAGTPEPVSNGCADGIGDPPSSSFGVQAGVWFSFSPSPTGHVLIEAVSDLIDDEIELQLAVYSSSTNDCTGQLTEIASIHTPSDLDESLEISCLDENQTYFLLVDGGLAELNQGIFTLTINDAGDETVTETVSATICNGETYSVGNSVYDQEGTYTDTLLLPSGCDSIVITLLDILEPIVINVSIDQQGLNQGNTDGQVSAAPTGGDGNYSYSWSDGQTTQLATNLVGGDIYCVEITDQTGCQADTCFEMPYYVHFVPDASGDLLDCKGDKDGTLAFTASLGVPPYLFSWQNSQSTISGSGTIPADGELITINNLPAGIYSIQMQDIYFDTVVIVEIVEPEALNIPDPVIDNASCFQNCDGSIQALVQGGTAPYQVQWDNGMQGETLTGLCAGKYTALITDANGCTATFEYEVEEPEEFIAQAVEDKGVSCFEGSDGEASVTTNGTPVAFLWSINNANTETVTGLAGGTYTVTVTNDDGCTATSSVEISTPSEPLEVQIELVEPVLCQGDQNASLKAIVSGPATGMIYNWSSGADSEIAGNLGAGTYTLEVENDKGCIAMASFTIDEPDAIAVDFTTNNLSCLDPIDGGVITIDATTGGIPPYSYSRDGFNFSADELITGFSAGEQTFYIRDAGGCVKAFTATIDGPTELWVDIGPDEQIDLGDQILLEAQVNNPDVTFQWSPVEFLDCTDCTSQEVWAAPVESTLYTVTVTDAFDCTAVADIFIQVVKRRKVYVPNAFSPNGDGINDEFMPFTGNDVARVKDFKIFDRQGNMVFSAGTSDAGDNGNAWNGTFRGKIMQPAVFVWFAEIEFLDGDVEIYKGEVNLLR